MANYPKSCKMTLNLALNLQRRIIRAKSNPPHPFLKWVGGKRQIMPELLAHLPKEFNDYHEPFVGGGALFIELLKTKKIKKGFISDINKELITTYRAVRNQVGNLIKELSCYPYNSCPNHSYDFFYKLRAYDWDDGLGPRDPKGLPLIKVAARMIYLNKTCFNGLYRVNSRGLFNTPKGKYTNPLICDSENLRAVSKLLRTQSMPTCSTFESIMDVAKGGDLVYLDPPYAPLNKTSNFTSFSSKGFSDHDQERLRDICLELTAIGAYVMLSNSKADIITSLYKHSVFNRYEVSAKRSINSDPEKRGKLSEYLITNF